jgi:hypothetical protein
MPGIAIERDNESILDLGVLTDGPCDFAQLDAESADLDQIVGPPDKFGATIG